MVSTSVAILERQSSTPAGTGLFHEPYLAASRPVGFAGVAAVEAAADLFPAAVAVSDPNRAGVVRRYGLSVSPGVVRIKSFTRGSENSRPGNGSKRGRITYWSAKSRLRMVETMASLDWTPVVEAPGAFRPGMVTLTAPGDWLEVAPDAAAWKSAVSRLRKRWDRRYGAVSWVWKLEFQRRGAPHYHIYTAVPIHREFREWLSRNWTECLFRVRLPENPDESNTPKRILDSLRAGTGVDWKEGLRASDPRRMAVYFLKRATGHNLKAEKEYQHLVPPEWAGVDRETGEAIGRGGAGRFWGYLRLERLVRIVELDDVQFLAARRLFRRYTRAQGRPLKSLSTGRLQGGMLLLNDAPSFVVTLARWQLIAPGDPAPQGVWAGGGCGRLPQTQRTPRPLVA